MNPSEASWSVGVVVPAQNEETTIESCIHSVKDSLANAAVGDHWIVVVADACTDRTVERAHRALGGAGEVLKVDFRSAGAARREGAERVLCSERRRPTLHAPRVSSSSS